MFCKSVKYFKSYLDANYNAVYQQVLTDNALSGLNVGLIKLGFSDPYAQKKHDAVQIVADEPKRDRSKNLYILPVDLVISVKESRNGGIINMQQLAHAEAIDKMINNDPTLSGMITEIRFISGKIYDPLEANTDVGVVHVQIELIYPI